MNKWIGMGRLTADPEIRTYQKKDGSQGTVSTYTLAIDRRGAKDGQQTADFIRCKGFDAKAEFAEKYLKKGKKLLVEGEVQTGSYTNPEGQKIYTTDVLIHSQEFAESKGSSAATQPAPVDENGFMNIPDGIDEELPFN